MGSCLTLASKGHASSSTNLCFLHLRMMCKSIRDNAILHAKGLRTTNWFFSFSHEDPNQHVRKFIKLYNTFKFNGVLLILNFYPELRDSITGNLDVAANGVLLSKSLEEVTKITKDMTENNPDNHHSWHCSTEPELVGYVGNPKR
ncbi:hypothetical protein ES288_D01G177800v1 [Gossypium darwinii]|uniref:Uncharacterized protein n=1 Tax=Gossypium darwinii TaxID=34276 RepID=A0A5D2DQY0_GOSDA|nr:hypothetical protein ES288_D01G177800v1 [Gossypium darwinii]